MASPECPAPAESAESKTLRLRRGTFILSKRDLEGNWEKFLPLFGRCVIFRTASFKSDEDAVVYLAQSHDFDELDYRGEGRIVVPNYIPVFRKEGDDTTFHGFQRAPKNDA